MNKFTEEGAEFGHRRVAHKRKLIFDSGWKFAK